MNCPNCGAYNNASSFRCIRCGRALPPPDYSEATDQQAFGEENDPLPTGNIPYDEQQNDAQPQPYASTESWNMGSANTGRAEPVPDYLIPSVLATLFCCLPAGLVSLYYSAQARGRSAAGDFTGARETAGSARTWLFVAVGAGFLWFFGWICIAIAGG